MLKFSGKNKVSCNNVSMKRIILEYIWWTLAGKTTRDSVNKSTRKSDSLEL